MIIFKLLIVFLTVMLLVAKKQPIYLAVSVGAAVTWLLYGISFADGLATMIRAWFSLSALQLIAVMYLITFLQKLMGERAPSNEHRRAFLRCLTTAGSTAPLRRSSLECCQRPTPPLLPVILSNPLPKGP